MQTDDLYEKLTGGANKASTHSPQGHVSSQLPGREDGVADAYRHILLSAELYRNYPKYIASSELALHERNQSGAATEMDAYNNEIGRVIGEYFCKDKEKWSGVFT